MPVLYKNNGQYRCKNGVTGYTHGSQLSSFLTMGSTSF
jgi:hypothetical protein